MLKQKEYKENLLKLLENYGVLENATKKMDNEISKNYLSIDFRNEKTIQKNLEKIKELYPKESAIKKNTPDTWLKVIPKIADIYTEKYGLPVAKINNENYLGFSLNELDKHSFKQTLEVLKNTSLSIKNDIKLDSGTSFKIKDSKEEYVINSIRQDEKVYFADANNSDKEYTSTLKELQNKINTGEYIILDNIKPNLDLGRNNLETALNEALLMKNKSFIDVSFFKEFSKDLLKDVINSKLEENSQSISNKNIDIVKNEFNNLKYLSENLDLNNNGILDKFEQDMNKNSINDKLEYFNENLKINAGKKNDTSVLPISDFEKIGISKTELFNKFSKTEFSDLLSGNKTNMFALDLIDKDLQFKVDVKLSLKENPDKSFSLRVHPFRKEIENNYNLSAKELQNLKAGKIVEKEFQAKGNEKGEKHIFQLDKDINEIVKLKSKDLDKKLDLNLSAEQKEAVISGKTINIKSKDKSHNIKLDLNKTNGLSFDTKELSKDLKMDKAMSKEMDF